MFQQYLDGAHEAGLRGVVQTGCGERLDAGGPFVTAGPAVAGPGAVFAHAGARAAPVTSEGQPPAHGRDDAAARAETFESLVASLGWRWALRCRGRVASAPRREAGVLAGCIANKGP